MDAQSRDFHDGRGCIKIFILQFTQAAAVYRVSVVASEAFHVKILRPGSNLFIRRKGNLDRPMRFLFLNQLFSGNKNFCYPGLVVAAEKSGAVCGNQCFSDLFPQRGEFFGRKAQSALQRNRRSVIVFDNLRLNIFPADTAVSIHVSDESNCMLSGIRCRDAAINISFFVQKSIFDTDLFHQAHDAGAQYLLAGGTGSTDGTFIRSGRIGDQIKKQFSNIHCV